jgi:hypothetical protein
MAILKEYRCAAHGEFESTEHACPLGCPARFVVQEIRTPPAYHDGITRNTDQTLRQLADEHGLTDMSNRNGSIMNSQRPQSSDGPDFSPKWLDIPHATPGWSRREGEKSPVVAMDSMGHAGDLPGAPANIIEKFKNAGVHLPGPTLRASKEAGLLVGSAKREELE